LHLLVAVAVRMSIGRVSASEASHAGRDAGTRGLVAGERVAVREGKMVEDHLRLGAVLEGHEALAAPGFDFTRGAPELAFSFLFHWN
jgi:hypothetical protein